jgi:linoleoyl-CoA desaturase
MNTAIFNKKTAEESIYTALNTEVERYFKDNNLSKKGNAQLYIKGVFFMASIIYAYIQLVFFTPESLWFSVPLCIYAGFTLAFIGFNVMHDACHGSYSESKKTNDFMSYSMNFLGSANFIWKVKHNVVHHSFTNIDGIDADIIQTKLLRFAPTQQKRSVHRYQHLYALVLYALSYTTWILFNDFEKYYSQKVYQTPIPRFNTRERIIFWISKIYYVSVYLAIPIFMLGALKALIGYSIISAACGIMLAVVFQLAHVVEKTEFEDATDTTLLLEAEWAEHQLNTTANFATDNKLVSWFLGGLNFQVEHHLFPYVSHVHYPKIQPIVQRVCAQYGVAYRSYPTLGAALRSHFAMLRILGSLPETRLAAA